MPATNKKTNSSKSKTAQKKKSYYEEPEQLPASTEDYSLRMFVGIFALLLGIILVVSMFYTDGKILNAIAGFFKGLLGWGYWLSGPCFIVSAGVLMFIRSKPIGFRLICLALLPVFFSALINIIGDFTIDYHISVLYEGGKDFLTGGVIGGAFAWMLYTYIGKVASCIILILFLVLMVFGALGVDADTFTRAPEREEQAPAAPKESLFAPRASMTNEIEAAAVPKSSSSFSFSLFSKKPEVTPAYPSTPGKGLGSAYNIPLGGEEPSSMRSAAAKKSPAAERRTASVPELVEEEVESVPAVPAVKTPESKKQSKIPISIEKGLAPVAAASTIEDTAEPVKITKEEIRQEAESVAREVSERVEAARYEYPEVSLLNVSKFNGNDSKEQLYETQERLESTLHSFGINSKVEKITPGPTVTRYDIKLEQGVKLSKVTNLAGDLALALGVLNVRVAPIPDEISTVGIEVPNKIVNTVSLREIIESDNYKKAASHLSFAIGKDIGGNAIVGDISKLPHMLIAGTTGSGKSVCMNSLILSLLFKSRPDEVKFIMIDPKMVELGIYNAIPHLYTPVVTEPKKAAGALQWAVVEMLKRYKLFSEAGVRDLATYNKTCAASGEPALPQVVILIDELADLMMAASKEVEESICRIAQMGRAAGMHLVIATQRPSADVITGLMKANIPSRIAFAVSSAMESRIIMDQSGAEKLIGHGDMLYSPLGSGKPLRVQGCFVSDEEREEVVQFIKNHSDARTETPEELTEALNKGVEGDSAPKDSRSESESTGLDYDEMLPKAVDVVMEMKSCSVSMLQRRLKLGYSRAARVVDQMEELGVVGPYEGAKPRSVPMSRSEWNDLALSLHLLSEEEIDQQLELDDYGGENDAPLPLTGGGSGESE